MIMRAKERQQALDMLMTLIDEHLWEYPTAHEHVCVKFNLSESESLWVAETYYHYCS